MVAGWNSPPDVVHDGPRTGVARGIATEPAKRQPIRAPQLAGWRTRLLWAVVALLGLVGVGVMLSTVEWSLSGATGQEAANTLLARRFVVDEVLNGGQLATVDTIVAQHALVQTPAGQAIGPDAVKELVGELYAAVPDGLFAVDDITAKNDAVAIRWTLRGTAQAPIQGLDAVVEGAQITAPGILVVRMVEGGITEFHFAFDPMRCC